MLLLSPLQVELRILADIDWHSIVGLIDLVHLIEWRHIIKAVVGPVARLCANELRVLWAHSLDLLLHGRRNLVSILIGQSLAVELLEPL